MASGSTIEWTECTWNPVVGCTKVSAGCTNCYAERMSKRLAAMAQGDVAAGRNPGKKSGYLNVINDSGNWNNKVFLDDSALDIPKSWRTPRVIFVNSMSDLFHEKVPLSFISRVFKTMIDCPHHIFQVLTKRPERAEQFAGDLSWPSNIWLGTSIENAAVSQRKAILARVPAKTRFLSLEPLLGPLGRLSLSRIHWVIVGGESGPGARPMKEEWVLELRDMCVDAGVSFFFKQWGGTNKKKTGRLLCGRTWDQMPTIPN